MVDLIPELPDQPTSGHFRTGTPAPETPTIVENPVGVMTRQSRRRGNRAVA